MNKQFLIVSMISICQDTWKTQVLDYLSNVAYNDHGKHLLLKNDTFHPDYQYYLEAEVFDEEIEISFKVTTVEDDEEYLVKGIEVTIPNNNDIASLENKEVLSSLDEDIRSWIKAPALYYQSVVMTIMDNLNISSDTLVIDSIGLNDGSVAYFALDDGNVQIIHDELEGESKVIQEVSSEDMGSILDFTKDWVFNWVLGDM